MKLALIPAFVAVDDAGPYPALIEPDLSPQGHVIPHFAKQTLIRMAYEMHDSADYVGEAIMGYDPDEGAVFDMIHWGGPHTIHRDIEPQANGLYRVTGKEWPWRRVAAPR